MVYGLLGLNWVVAGTVREEIWAWSGLCLENECNKMIPLLCFGLFGRRGTLEL